MLALATKLLVRFYQYTIGTVLPDSCRFLPTCSEYTIQAVEKRGVFGLWLAARRILRCHPWGGSGYDPVPENSGATRDRKSETKNGKLEHRSRGILTLKTQTDPHGHCRTH